MAFTTEGHRHAIPDPHQWCLLPGFGKTPVSLLANNLLATMASFWLTSVLYLILEFLEEITVLPAHKSLLCN